MASKKPVPLKDEQIYPTDEILQQIEQLTVAVNNLANEQQTIIRDIEALSQTKTDTVSSEVQEVITNLLGKYLLDVKKVETVSLSAKTVALHGANMRFVGCRAKFGLVFKSEKVGYSTRDSRDFCER